MAHERFYDCTLEPTRVALACAIWTSVAMPGAYVISLVEYVRKETGTGIYSINRQLLEEETCFAPSGTYHTNKAK